MVPKTSPAEVPSLAANDTSTVRSLEEQRHRAAVSADIKMLMQLWHPHLTYTHSLGQRDTYHTMIEKVSSGYFDYQWIDHRETAITIENDTALVYGIQHGEVFVGAKNVRLHNATLAVWTRQEGVWRLIAFQPTVLPASRDNDQSLIEDDISHDSHGADNCSPVSGSRAGEIVNNEYISDETEESGGDAIAVLRRFYAAEEAYLAPDGGDFAVIAATLHPDCVIYQADSLPYAGEWRGHRGFEDWMKSFSKEWSALEVRDSHFYPSGADTIFSHSLVSATAKISGSKIQFPLLQMITTRQNLILAIRPFYWDTAEVLRALGRAGADT